MTPEQYLKRQERVARERIARATRRTGGAVETVVDVPGMVRRRPVLALGAGAVAGFLAGSSIRIGSRRVAGTAARSVVYPLLRPTVQGLGTALAGLLLGEPDSSG